MTIIVEKYQDEPIIIATLTEPMDFQQDIPYMFTYFGISRFYSGLSKLLHNRYHDWD